MPRFFAGYEDEDDGDFMDLMVAACLKNGEVDFHRVVTKNGMRIDAIQRPQEKEKLYEFAILYLLRDIYGTMMSDGKGFDNIRETLLEELRRMDHEQKDDEDDEQKDDDDDESGSSADPSYTPAHVKCKIKNHSPNFINGVWEQTSDSSGEGTVKAYYPPPWCVTCARTESCEFINRGCDVRMPRNFW